jgi:hypothetical protein
MLQQPMHPAYIACLYWTSGVEKHCAQRVLHAQHPPQPSVDRCLANSIIIQPSQAGPLMHSPSLSNLTEVAHLPYGLWLDRQLDPVDT